jgi:hypothetical protein
MRLRDSMKIWALACFAANQLVLADPAPDESRACEAANPREA